MSPRIVIALLAGLSGCAADYQEEDPPWNAEDIELMCTIAIRSCGLDHTRSCGSKCTRENPEECEEVCDESYVSGSRCPDHDFLVQEDFEYREAESETPRFYLVAATAWLNGSEDSCTAFDWFEGGYCPGCESYCSVNPDDCIPLAPVGTEDD